MYRTSLSTRILSAAVAAVFGLGLVATAGGALHEERASTKAQPLQVIHLEPVVVRMHPTSQFSAACEQAPKAAL
jgi:hypothetical protein